MAPFKKVFKNTSGLVSFLPNSFLHLRQALGITNLYQAHLTNHVTMLNNGLNSGSTFSRILQHRLFQIASDLNIPFSPLLLNNFDAFTKTSVMKSNFIFSVLYFSSLLGISYARPLQASRSVDSTPIYSLFSDNPSLYAKSLHMIKRSRIMYLHQCISADFTALLLYKQPSLAILTLYQALLLLNSTST